MILFNFVRYFFLIFSALGLLVVKAQAQENFKYQATGAIELKIKLDYHSRKTILRIHNLRVIENELHQTLAYRQGWLYHTESESIYGTGLSRNEFETEILRRDQPSSKYVLLFLNLAFADTPECNEKENLKAVANLSQSMKLSEMGKAISGCNFSISDIVEKQITSIYDTTHNIITGKIWDQLTSAVNSLKEMLPQIYDKLVIPLEKLSSAVPTIANKMVCDFTQKKIGQIALVALTGGTGLSVTMARISEDVVEIVNKVDVFSKNQKLLDSLVQAEKKGHLDATTIERVLKLERDVPSSHKNSNVKFRSQENLKKHFEKHGKEMGTASAEDYEAAARTFLKGDGGNYTVALESAGGDFTKWNTLTGEYIATNKYGNIITYFKLACKADHEKLLYMLNPTGASSQGICRER